MEKPLTITKYKPGSVAELITIALPLIIASLSENIMIFFDRIILSHYSLVSLNSATLASQAVEIFQYGLWAIAGISELFVARLYAKGATTELAKPCWQMIFLSIYSLPIIFLLSQYTAGLILSSQYLENGQLYYKILLYSVPLIGMVAALSGFFVGQGKLKLVLYSTVSINLINLALDFILIFGVRGLLPAMGTAGAAISAVVSLVIQVVWLMSIYLNKYHRQHFQTLRIVFNKRYFLKSLQIGSPIALSHAFEMLGWLFIIRLVAETGAKNFTIISIGSTLYLIYAFINDGLYRSLATIVSNHISSNNVKAIKYTLYSGFKMLFAALLLLALLMMLAPNFIIKAFNLSKGNMVWQHDIRFSFIFIWCYFLLTGIYWLYGAILTAKQHTKFIMLTNIISIWLITVLPIYIISTYYALSATWIWPLICGYVLISGIAMYIRYKFKIA